MNQKIIKYLKKISYDTKDINCLLVSAFIYINKIKNINNNFIKSFIIEENHYQLNEFIKILNLDYFDIEKLIEFFEFVISPEDKEVNGAVYTPEFIRRYIVEESIKLQKNKNIDEIIYGDIACGCGGFFKTITEVIREKTNKSYFEIYNENLFGLDIQEYSITRTKILLVLIALIDKEDCEEFSFNLYQGNALSFEWNQIEIINKNNGFDIIIGNPPYVSSSKIDIDTKLLLNRWSVTKSGKSDLYIPFFEIALENINSEGVLGYITVNTFYKSQNGRALRKYLSRNKFNLIIIDFRAEQLFKNRTTYTCICLISKIKSNNIKYIKSRSTEINSIKKSNFINIPYSELNNFDGWFLMDNKTKKIINKIESTGNKLGEKFEIRNGFATLKNNIYIFTPTKTTDDYYYLLKDNIEYKIEKKICREVIKPNILKSASEIESKTEKLIFPYKIEYLELNLFEERKQSIKLIDEKTLKHEFSNTYGYLKSQKEILSKRDKGNREYETWYAFGRSQALLISGYKLLLPYITNKPCFVYTDKRDLLFYNGYGIISNSIEDLMVLQKILMSKIFWFYIKTTSKPYSGNYYSVAKNYIKNFGLCDLSEDEKIELLAMEDKQTIDDFLFKKYKIDFIENF